MAEDGIQARGFALLHQRNVLDVNLAGVINATATLTIEPRNPSLRTVHLHASPLIEISSVTLSSSTANPLLPTPASFAHVAPLQLPNREPPIDIRSHPEVKRKTWAGLGEQDEGELAILVTGGWIRLNDDGTRLAPIDIRIEYRVAPGIVDGLTFHADHMYTSPNGHDAARLWTPCVDSLWERCTWELDIMVASENVAIATGELQEQVIHENSTKRIFSYLQTNPTSAQHVGFAVGPFELYEIEPKLLAFCLPGNLDMLIHSTSFMPKAMSFYSVLGSYPFQDFKMVFVSGSSSTFSTLGIFSDELLYNDNVIDQAIETRLALSLALIQQWLGLNIIPRTLADTWLVNGLALYVHSMFVKDLLGNNEYRFRLKQDIDRCVRLDQGEQEPICVSGALHLDVQFINLKAPLVLHLLDRHMAQAGTSLGLGRIIPRILLAAYSEELTGNTLSTQYFLKTCRKMSGLDLQTFQDQWVYGKGCPTFRLSTNFIRKKFLVELRVEVVHPVPIEGSLTVRIHEADGAPFEHVVDIKQAVKTFNLPFNTKYKRTRRSGRMAARFNQLQEDLEDPLPTGAFAYPAWEDEETRREWRVAEWTDDEAEKMLAEGSGYEWIRVDPECEWLATFEFSEKPWYWISQLQGDRDVVAQLEAIRNMVAYPSPTVASELAKTVLVENYFYRIRMAAARALLNYNNSECDYLGLFLLVKLFHTIQLDNVAEYFIKCSIVATLGDLRDPTTRTSWREVKGLLLAALEGHESTPVFDNYVATLVSAIGNAFSTAHVDDRDVRLGAMASTALDRALTTDRLVPSFHNVVTRASLQLILGGHRINDPHIFLAYTREGNLLPLRLMAFDCLLLCKPPGRSMALSKYLVQVIRSDESIVVRRHVARSLAEAILSSVALGEVTSEATDSNAIVKAVRKDFSRKEELRDLIQDALIAKFPYTDHSIRFSLIKAAEIITSSQPEPAPGTTITLQTPAETPAITPKIRLSLDRTEYFQPPPLPQPQPIKITLNAIKKKVPKAQSKGLSASDVAAISIALKKLRNDAISLPFRQPVDPVRDGAPNYLQIVRTPMDLSTAGAKLDSGMYANRQEFVDDIKLIVDNCFLYNRKGSPMHKAGRAMQTLFDTLWAKTEATLSNALAPSASTSAGPSIAQSIAPSAPTKVKIAPPMPQVPPPTPKEAQKLVINKPTKPEKINKPEKVPPTPAAMAPPPLPKKVEKPKPLKRKSLVANEIDDLLGEELDAIESGHPEPAPKKVKMPQPPQPPAAPILERPKAVRPEPPANLPQTTGNPMPIKAKRVRMLISTLQKDPNAIIFLRPVDPIADGCPTYLQEIKEPMDLGTIVKKLDARKYKTMGQVAYDIELIFANCRKFNPPGEITALADHVESLYWKDWPKAVSPKMTGDERKALQALIAKAMKEEVSFYFREPVDPVALNIPAYFTIIPQEEARDLSLIRRKLNAQYSTAQQVDDDVELMLENARVFNGEGIVVDAANAFGRWWKQQRQKMDA